MFRPEVRAPWTARRPFGGSLRRLAIELLESRRMLAGVPSASVALPSQAMIGEAIDIAVTFDNTHASDAGYGPFIDVYLPTDGADGAASAPQDGLSYVANSANYLGAAVTTTVLVFPAGVGGIGIVSHPYAVDSAGAPLQVSGPTGDQLLVFQLPFGSFTAAQPAATINFQTQLSNLADLATPLAVRARSGFRYGNDPLDNPATDPTTLSEASTSATTWTPQSAVTPNLVQLTKTYIGPEDETATGPNFPRQYRIDVDVANGQTINLARIIDALPNNLQLVSIDTISPAGTVTTTPTTPANAPNNELIVSIPSITGTLASSDASVIFTFFVPFRDANSATVINPTTGDDAIAANNARFVGNWTPIDPRDPGGIDNAVVDVAGPEHTLIPKSIATQKSVTLVNDVGGGGFSAGDTVEYTIVFQVSDYFGFDNVVLTDLISDGQRFDTSFNPTLSVTEHGANSAGTISAGNFVVTDHFTGGSPAIAPLNGTQEIQFDISSQLVARALDGVLVGGMVPPAGTGGPDPGAGFNQGATTGTIVFRTVVQDAFTDNFPSGDASVDEGDHLTNDVSIVGSVLNYTNTTATGQSESDLSSANFDIVGGTLSKSIYAINGNTTLPTPLQLAPGDDITYRIELTLPNSDVEDLQLEDFLPLPVLAATQVTTFSDTISAAIPAAGTAKFGPTDTFRALFGSAPTLSTDAVSNRVAFDYGDFDIAPSQSSKIDLLFTVTASSAPFADGLFLTNQVRRTQGSTNASSIANDAIVQIQLGEPDLNIRKGVIATSNADAIFAPLAVGPVSFSTPGSAGYRGAATINSSNLSTTPVNSDVSSIDAGDLVSFAIVVENTGSSRKGAFDIRLRDTLPTGFVIPAVGAGLNMQVTDGTGAAIAFTTIGGGLFDAAGGIELTDPGPTTATVDGTDGGALDEYDPSDGRNIVIITYDLEVPASDVPEQTMVNTARLFNYAGTEAGPDFTTQDLTDTASATLSPIIATKTVFSTNQPSTLGSSVAIGEIVTYRSTITIPEGTSPSLVWSDTAGLGLSIIDVVSITGNATATADVTASAGTYAAILAAASINSASGGSASLNFGNVVNANRNDAVDEVLTIEYRAIVLNNTGNDRGVSLSNSSTVTWTGGTSNAAAANVTIVEPTLSVVKTILPATGQAGDTFTVTIDIAHATGSNASAFDVQLSDILPAGLNYSGAAPTASGLVPATLTEVGGTITATWATIPVGSTSQIQFNVQTDPGVIPGTSIVNTADSSWTGLPGDLSLPQTGQATSNERSGNTTTAGGANNDYRASGSDDVTVFSPVVTKTVVDTNQLHTAGSNVAIGEIVRYEVVIRLPQSTLPGASFVDTPDVGLAIIDIESIVPSLDISTSIAGSWGAILTAAAANATSNNGSSVLFDFGTLTNANTDPVADETITIRYRAVVLNNATNNRGTVLDNQGNFNWNTTGSLAVDGPNVTVVEPQLAIVVSDSVPATADAGDTVSFTIDVSHAGVSNSDAFDLSVENLINSVANHLQYAPSSLVVNSTGGAVFLSSSDAGGDLNGAWTEFPLGATATITFSALVQNTAPASATLTDTANLQWTSLPGNVLALQSASIPLSVERSGNTANIGAAANDHLSNDTGIVTTSAANSTKQIVATSQAETGSAQHDPARADVMVGETITFSIVAVLPEGTNTLTFTDQMPTGPGLLELVSATVGTIGGQITAGAATITIDNTNADAFNDRAVISFGSVLNSPDGLVNAGDMVEVRVVARVVDVAGNVDATILTNVASIDVGGAVTIATASAEIVEPQLQIDKIATSISGPAGSIVPYIVTIEHAAGSTAIAHDIAITDLLSDPNLNLVPGSVTTNRGTITSGNATGNSTVGLTLGSLALGEQIVITFNGRVNPSAGGAIVVNNTSSLQFDNLLGPGGRVDTGSDSATYMTSAPEIDLEVSITDSEDPTVIDNSGFFYTITVTNNGPSTATAVQLLENLPVGVSGVSALSSQGSASVGAGVVTASLGTLLPGQSATVVVALTTPSAPTTMNTTATVSAAETDIFPPNDIDLEPTIVLGVSSISGRSWVDTNSDGIVGAGEILLPGVVVTLSGYDYTGAAVVRTTTTNNAGNYTFAILRPGNYSIQQTQPTLFFDNNEYVGNGGGASPNNDTFQVALPAGVDVVDYFFTELGLRTEMQSKRSLLNSRLRQGPGLTFDDFYSMLAPRGTADIDGDGDIDGDDFALFQNRLGGTF